MVEKENVSLRLHYVSTCNIPLQPSPGARYVYFKMIPAAPVFNKTTVDNYFICLPLFSDIDSWGLQAPIGGDHGCV